jgi:diguanylate cyclase (GGDEF)-like protein
MIHIQQCLAQPYAVGERLLSLRVSMGASMYPEDGCVAAGLIQKADAAMYQAKAHGQQAYRFYETPTGWR